MRKVIHCAIVLCLSLVLTTVTYGACPSGFSDGCSGAPTGTIQYPNVLNIYAVANRPAWNVPGINYYVGIPSGTVLQDWRTISLPNVSVNTSSGLIGCTNAGASITLDKIDFTTGVGGNYFSAGTPCNLTLTNSLVGCGTSGGPNLTANIDGSGANLTAKFNKFDGTNCIHTGATTPSTFLGGDHTIIIQYNWFFRGSQHVLETGGAGTTIDYHFNLIDNMVWPGSDQHENWQQLSGTGTISSDAIEFNFAYHNISGTGAGEGFQFYCNSGPCTVSSPLLTHNVVITTAGTNMSFAMHSNGGGQTSAVTNGKDQYNFFDMQAGGPYYQPDSFLASQWPDVNTICNFDMATGKLINPHDNTESAPGTGCPPTGSGSTRVPPTNIKVTPITIPHGDGDSEDFVWWF